MKAILSSISWMGLFTAGLCGQTEFTPSPGFTDVLDELNWSNGFPAPGNDGTIAVDGDLTFADTLLEFGNVTVTSGATLYVPSRIRVNDTALTIGDGALIAEGNIALDLEASLTMTSANSVVSSTGNVVVKATTTLTLSDGDLTATGTKLNTDGTANLVGGSLTINALFDGGSGGVVNLTDTQITIPVPQEEPTTLTVFRTNDPWTFNFVSGGTGLIRIVGRDDLEEVGSIITNGTLFTIDGVLDNDLSSYSLTFDGTDTFLSLSDGTVAGPPIEITATSFDPKTRTFSLTWQSDDSSTYTLSESNTLLPGSWSPVDTEVDGLAGSTTYQLFDLPIGQIERFYRVQENP